MPGPNSSPRAMYQGQLVLGKTALRRLGLKSRAGTNVSTAAEQAAEGKR
jgi:hypothetical protein